MKLNDLTLNAVRRTPFNFTQLKQNIFVSRNLKKNFFSTIIEHILKLPYSQNIFFEKYINNNNNNNTEML